MSTKTASGGFKSERRRHDAMTVIFAILSVIYLIPVFLVAMNSFKRATPPLTWKPLLFRMREPL